MCCEKSYGNIRKSKFQLQKDSNCFHVLYHKVPLLQRLFYCVYLYSCICQAEEEYPSVLTGHRTALPHKHHGYRDVYYILRDHNFHPLSCLANIISDREKER